VRGAKPERALELRAARACGVVAGEVVVVAASGGPDSTALAALAAVACAEAGGSLLLAHVNHELRPGAWQDEAVVLAAGAALGARVVAVSLASGSRAEARLRDERYAALAKIARDARATRILSAHHAADQTETVLLALFRGAGPGGLAGMPFRRELEPGIALERPLLDVEPEELRAYCTLRHLAYALDPTNRDLTYRRNAVRATLPALRIAYPHLDAAVARCATILREERAGSVRAGVRDRLRSELIAVTGDARDVTFERLDAAARAIERGAAGRHFLRRGVEVVVE
jgi:tRNA(Ile)-lysidine synthase